MMLNAVSISTKVEDMIQGRDMDGFVHSIFDNACNIQLQDNDLIGLISSTYGDNPYSISIQLPENQTMRDLPIKQGMKIIINGERIRSVMGSFHISLQGATSWDPSLPHQYEHLVNRTQIKNNFRTIMRVLLEKGNFQGIGPIILEYPEIIETYNFQGYKNSIVGNHYCSFISPRIKEFVFGVIHRDRTIIDNMLARIVGFGPGLTPSADDMLVGLMAALYYLASYHGIDVEVIPYFRKRLNDELINQTTLVSGQMLKAAVQGEFARSLKDLCIAMITTDDRRTIEGATQEAINLGSTSGTDTVVGLLLGAYALNQINN